MRQASGLSKPSRPKRIGARAHRRTQPAVVRDRRGGFTLIEALVAFTILTLVTVVLQRAVVATLGGVTRAQDHLEAALVARTLMTGPLAVATGGEQEMTGRLDGHAWTIRFEPLDLGTAAAGAPPDWRPMRMRIEVDRGGAFGGVTSVETVRLVRSTSR